MIDESRHRRRFLEDDVPRRMGNLASTLNRLSSFVTLARPCESVLNLLDESLRFVQWTKGDLSEESAAELERLASDLKSWRPRCTDLHGDPELRSKLAAEAQSWSDRVLELSGLLTTGA